MGQLGDVSGSTAAKLFCNICNRVYKQQHTYQRHVAMHRDGWEEKETEGGHPYFWNSVKKTSTWHRPVELA
jgi:hypothetical protein